MRDTAPDRAKIIELLETELALAGGTSRDAMFAPDRMRVGRGAVKPACSAGAGDSTHNVATAASAMTLAYGDQLRELVHVAAVELCLVDVD